MAMHGDRVDRVRRILASRGLTLYEVSRRSDEIFGRASGHFIPHNLYYRLRSHCPNLGQCVTLAHVSNYRLSDWLAVFGLYLDQIQRIQPLLPRRHTVLLDSSLYDENAWVPWFVDGEPGVVPGIAPLAQLLRPGPAKRAKELAPHGSGRFLYAKIGENDLLAFPELLPGSIIRINPQHVEPPAAGAGPSRQIFLVESDGRLTCGRLQRVATDRLIACSSKFPFAYVHLPLDGAAAIRGVVDAELRPLMSTLPCVSKLTPDAVREPRRDRPFLHMELEQLLRTSRMRTGASFRQASSWSRQVAETLGDERYFIAPGTLSDYEALREPPRQIHKILSLCILHGFGFWEFLRASGLQIDPAAGDPIPDELIPRPEPKMDSHASRLDMVPQESGFLAGLVREWEEIPLFVKHSLDYASGLKDLSLSGIFWVGGEQSPIHPYLSRAAFVVVNRRIKKPERSAARMLWEQPLYMLLLREGTFLCGACTLEEDHLWIHPYPDRSFRPRKLRNQIDAEVIGQVTAILRRLI